MSRLSSTLTVTLGLALVGLAGPAAAGGHGVDPALHQASAWESPGVTCTKAEYADGVAALVLPAAPDGYAWTQVILKAGTQHTVLPASSDPAAVYAPANGKDISHAITCLGVDDGDDDGSGGGDV
ncbi:hypothetical protein [Actinotalea sp.]|uniref:hypothetical protein n=1 Tax=Actinotalea sp. TaxID=1872145 RepID=UPI002CEB3357|nr:hypothetical protein [Actinotalea sp.]HQY32646.1 hypothetical protein [Actinotalea sp.]HRA49893.1 hypothetical protein [Actinotalea sp.]